MSKRAVPNTLRILAGLLLGLYLVLVAFDKPGVSLAAGTVYYVSATSGSDSNNGLSTSTPFLTIQKAADLTNPGDTVYVMDGLYSETSSEGVVQITRSGSPNAYITYSAYPGQHPKLHVTTSWNHILVAGASYIKINGFEIEGNNANISYDQAYAQRNNSNNPATNTNGILVRRDSTQTIYPHHVVITNNLIHDCPGAGIGAEYADYITVANNNVHSNSYYTIYATSGISLFHLHDSDSYTGYKNYVLNNISDYNQTYVPWIQVGRLSDGNGIIIDDNLHTQDNQTPYNGRTLVANNITFDNGGSGIHSFSSQHVDIINNTAYSNSQSPTLHYGNIFAADSNDVYLLNNISYAKTGENANTNNGNTNVVYDYNIYYNGTVAAQGPNDIVADPKFANISAYDFELQASSPAIDSGTSNKAPSTDFYGTPRPLGSVYDRGAYEWGNPNGSGSRQATSTIEAESFDAAQGVATYSTVVGDFDNTDWVRYNHVNFGTGVSIFKARVAVPASNAGQRFQLRLDSPDGLLIGTLSPASTGDWNTYITELSSVTNATGVHTLYIVGVGSNGIGNLDWFTFS